MMVFCLIFSFSKMWGELKHPPALPIAPCMQCNHLSVHILSHKIYPSLFISPQNFIWVCSYIPPPYILACSYINPHLFWSVYIYYPSLFIPTPIYPCLLIHSHQLHISQFVYIFSPKIYPRSCIPLSL